MKEASSFIANNTRQKQAGRLKARLSQLEAAGFVAVLLATGCLAMPQAMAGQVRETNHPSHALIMNFQAVRIQLHMDANVHALPHVKHSSKQE